MNNIKIISAKYLNEYKIEIEFSDGIKKVVDLKNELWGEVFELLKDIKKFKAYKLNPFTIEWDTGADFSPDFLYELAQSKKTKSQLKNLKSKFYNDRSGEIGSERKKLFS